MSTQQMLDGRCQVAKQSHVQAAVSGNDFDKIMRMIVRTDQHCNVGIFIDTRCFLHRAGFAGWQKCLRLKGRRFGQRCLRRLRQPDGKGAPTTDLAGNSDVAGVGSDDALDDGKTQAGAAVVPRS